MRPLSCAAVLALSACSGDATETVVTFTASSHYAGGTVTLGTEARTLDPNGHAEWIVEPPIVDELVSITLELGGVRESFLYGTEHLRRDGTIPEGAPLDRLSASVFRDVETGACVALTSYAAAGTHGASSDPIGVDSRRCGPFAP
jgi:hypothetical protein